MLMIIYPKANDDEGIRLCTLLIDSQLDQLLPHFDFSLYHQLSEELRWLPLSWNCFSLSGVL
jgi:hypothetical protein